jgi:hypothetical protein
MKKSKGKQTGRWFESMGTAESIVIHSQTGVFMNERATKGKCVRCLRQTIWGKGLQPVRTPFLTCHTERLMCWRCLRKLHPELGALVVRPASRTRKAAKRKPAKPNSRPAKTAGRAKQGGTR